MWFGCNQHWGRREVFLQILQHYLGFWVPLHWPRLLQDLEERKGTLHGLGDEPAHGSNAASEPTHVLDPFGCLNLLDGLDLIWVCLNPALRHKEPEKFAGRNTKDTLLRVQLEVDLV